MANHLTLYREFGEGSGDKPEYSKKLFESYLEQGTVRTLNTPDKYGIIPISALCNSKFVTYELLKAYLEAGANINLIHDYMEPPFFLLLYNERFTVEMLNLCLQYNAKGLHMKYNVQQTIFYYLLRKGHLSADMLLTLMALERDELLTSVAPPDKF